MQKKNTTTHFENIDESESDYDDEDGELEESFELEIDEEFKVKTEFNIVINRVRECCKMFNKSNEKHQKLQSYVLLQEKKWT